MSRRSHSHRRLAAANQLRMGDNSRIILRHVVRSSARAGSRCGHTLEVRRFRQHPVVTHGRDRQFAGVLQGHLDLGAIGGDRNLVRIEFHGVVALDRDVARLRRSHRTEGAEYADCNQRGKVRLNFIDISCLSWILSRLKTNAPRTSPVSRAFRRRHPLLVQAPCRVRRARSSSSAPISSGAPNH